MSFRAHLLRSLVCHSALPSSHPSFLFTLLHLHKYAFSLTRPKKANNVWTWLLQGGMRWPASDVGPNERCKNVSSHSSSETRRVCSYCPSLGASPATSLFTCWIDKWLFVIVCEEMLNEGATYKTARPSIHRRPEKKKPVIYAEKEGRGKYYFP